MEQHDLGVTRASGLIGISRSVYGYQSRRPDDTELKDKLCSLAAKKRRYGYRRLHILLVREGIAINRKKTFGSTEKLG